MPIGAAKQFSRKQISCCLCLKSIIQLGGMQLTGNRGRIDSAAVYRELACCCFCFGGWVREGMQVGGHSEHGTGPVDAVDFS